MKVNGVDSMRKSLFTRRRVKNLTLISVGFFLFAVLLWAGFRAELYSKQAIPMFKIGFNISLAVSFVLLVFGGIAPVSTTAIVQNTRDKWLRDRIENHVFFRQFIITDKEVSDE